DGDPNKLSIELVQHPAIKAVGFTGSLGGGRALMDAAAARPEPIPVYAEMGSVNPVFVLPGAIAGEPGREQWAKTLATAVIGAAGIVHAYPAEYRVLADSLEGQLTATIVADDASDSDRSAARGLLPSLAAKAGRVVWNGVPTGVAVVEAMQHGGPWPATSASW